MTTQLDHSKLVIDETVLNEIDGELRFAAGVMYFETDLNPFTTNILVGDGNNDIPTKGTAWSTNHPNLILTERGFQVVSVRSDPPTIYTVRVSLIYRNERFGAGLSYAVSGTSSLSEATTIRNVADTVVEVEDPANAEFKVSIPTIVQVPRTVTRRTLLHGTNTPDGFAAIFIGHVNSSSWRDAGPRQWLCTHAGYEGVNLLADPALYRFEFEFERSTRLEGWVYDMVFRDATNRIPEGVDFGAQGSDQLGVQTFEFHPQRDFGFYFP